MEYESRWRFFPLLLAGVALLAAAAVAVLWRPVEAQQLLPDSGSLGYDISWPQCGGQNPEHPFAFGVVGVTGGKSFTANPCLASQYRWAGSAPFEPMVYMNLNAPPKNSSMALYGPAGFCSKRDFACQAYNYGWNNAVYAYGYATDQGVDASFWWLDIETMNTWSRNKELNAMVIQAAIDYLQTQAGVQVGIYSTPYQWGVIAGTFAPGLPVWTAGASDAESAPGRCNERYAFGGGEVVMVQWVETYDRNYVC